MTDMRATERLLEVIATEADRAISFAGLSHPAGDSARVIELVVAELRRRGDTLVRRDDLLRVLESSGTPLFNPSSVNPDLLQARERLEREAAMTSD